MLILLFITDDEDVLRYFEEYPLSAPSWCDEVTIANCNM